MYLTIAVSLLLATKYEEIHPAPIDDFIHVLTYIKTKNYPQGINVDRETFMEVERKILVENDWNFSRPIGINYLRILTITISSQLDETRMYEVHQLSKFILEASVINSKTCHLSPSSAAVFSVIAAKNLINEKYRHQHNFNQIKVWGNIEEKITGYKENDQGVQNCVVEMKNYASQLIINAPKHRPQPSLDNLDFTNKYDPSLWNFFKQNNYQRKTEQNKKTISVKKPIWR